MKKLELNQMESLTAGVSDRACMVAGGLAVLSLAGGMAGFLVAAGITAGAGYAGCF